MRLRKLFCLVLILPLFCGTAAADTAFSFRNGVTWDTTPQQMLAAEGLSESGVNKHDGNGYTYYYLRGQDVYYVFRGERLVQAYTVQSGSAYDAALERLKALYGAAADVSADTVTALLNILVPSSVMPSTLGSLAAWRLSDGTLAALFIIDGACCTAYFHEQRILGGN